MTEQEIARRAAEIVKIMRLSRNDMLDEIAIKLNREPTYDEQQVALLWMRAIKLAEGEGRPWDLARQLSGKD